MTLLEAGGEYVGWLEARGYSANTVRLRRLCLRDLLSFLRNRSVEEAGEVDRGMMEAYRSEVMGREHAYTGRKLSPSTVGHYLETARMFFECLMRRKAVLFNPAAGLTWPKRGPTLPRNIPTEEEMERVMARPDTGTPAGLRDRTVLEVMYSTGIRREEAAMLDVYDVNLGEGTLTVRRGKGGKGRVLPVGRTALGYLARYVSEARPRLVNGSGREGALFVMPGGERLSKAALGRMVAKHVKAVKPGVTLGCHAVRHAFATHMLKGGADLAVIQRMLGHAEIGTTEVYTHVAPVDLKREHRRRHPRGREGGRGADR